VAVVVDATPTALVTQPQLLQLLVEVVEVLLISLLLLVGHLQDLENQHNPTLAAVAVADGIMELELEKAVLEVLVLLLSVIRFNL
jgi:hypothetical protein